MQKFYFKFIILTFSIDLHLKLELVRYGIMPEYPCYEKVRSRSATELAKSRNGHFDRSKFNDILRTANIIFSPIKQLYTLSRYVNSINFNWNPYLTFGLIQRALFTFHLMWFYLNGKTLFKFQYLQSFWRHFLRQFIWSRRIDVYIYVFIFAYVVYHVWR